MWAWGGLFALAGFAVRSLLCDVWHCAKAEPLVDSSKYVFASPSDKDRMNARIGGLAARLDALELHGRITDSEVLSTGSVYVRLDRRDDGTIWETKSQPTLGVPTTTQVMTEATPVTMTPAEFRKAYGRT